MPIPGLSGPGSGFAIGYGAQVAGQGASAYYGLQDGRYYTPEAQQEAVNDVQYSSAGLLAGTVIGAAIAGPEGAIAGQFIGQAGGQAYSSYLNAGQEREQSTRETAEGLATAIGAATSQVREFAETLSNAGAPIKELQSAFAVMSAAGPGLNAGASIAGAADLSNSLGERFLPAFTGVEGFLAGNPILAPNVVDFNAVGGKLSSQRLGNLSVISAFGGNFKTSEDALTLEEGAATSVQRKNDLVTRDTFEKENYWDNWVQNDYDEFRRTLGIPVNAANSKVVAAAEANKRLGLPDPEADAARQRTTKERDAAFELYSAAAADQQFGSSSVSSISAQISLADVGGATDADLAKLGTSLTGAVGIANPAWESLSAGITTYINNNPKLDPNDRRQLEALRNQANTMPLQNELTSAQVQRSILERSIGTNVAEFGEWQTSNTLAGATPTQMAGAFDSEAAYYEDLAANAKGLRPAERARFRQQAQQIRFQSGTDGESSFREDISVLGTERGRLAQDVGEAERSGSYADVASAERLVAGNELRQVYRDQQRIAQGVPWAEQQNLTREIDSLTGMAAQTNYAAGIQRYEGERSEIGYDISDAGLNRRMRLLGNTGMAPGDLDAVRREVSLDQIELGRNTDPKRTPMLMDRIQSDEALLGDREEAARRFRPSAGQSAYLIETETEYDLARMAPYQGGPDSNPWQRGMALENVLQGQIASRDANRRRLQSQGQWNGIDEQNYAQDSRADRLQEAGLEHDRLFSMYSAVPEAVIGSPGGGIGAAVINPAALSAYFNPTPVAGGFGNTPGSTQQMANAPGSVAGFQQAAGGDHSAQMTSLLSQILQAIVSGRGINAGGVPHNDASGVASMFLQKSFDPVNRH
jgi:hypothetical protein